MARTGDIVALAGLKDTITGDTLCDMEKPIVLERMEFPDPVIKVCESSRMLQSGRHVSPDSVTLIDKCSSTCWRPSLELAQATCRGRVYRFSPLRCLNRSRVQHLIAATYSGRKRSREGGTGLESRRRDFAVVIVGLLDVSSSDVLLYTLGISD